MTELYGWKLSMKEYEHDEDSPFKKYFIRRQNAVAAGAVFLQQTLEGLEWDTEWITKAQEEYQELMNTAEPMANVTTPIDSYFEHNSISIELLLIPYEDELK